VAACKAPDGSYWALQDWHVRLPDLGFLPWTSAFSARDLNLSHWTGREQAKLEVHNAWISGRWHQIFGRATYKTQPVYGFKTTRFGAGLDGYVRTLYLDTHNSMYGRGWRRENAFVSHRPSGMFCYTFYPHDPTRGGYRHPPGFTSERGPGTGDRYRLSMRGPGVTPDVSATWGGLHAFDHGNETDVELQQDAMRTLGGMLKQTPDALCRAGHLGELPG
jgi:hypothetical protein